MNQIRLLELTEEVLGSSGKKQSKGEYLFYCPACNHYKPKLIVKIDSQYQQFGHWHCWVCSETNNTKGKSLYSLFKRFNASEYQINELNELLNNRSSYNLIEEDENKIISLPPEYKPLWTNDNSLTKRHAMVYLRKRGISEIDIMRYQIGYASSGEYKNRIIFPSFDNDLKLNYFVSRSIFDNTLKYKNPEFSKDVIGYEWLINWKLPIVLVEGVFDAISVKINSMPLFGKSLLNKLHYTILKEKPPAIYICLDDDAIQNSIKMVEIFLNQGINTYLVKLNKKDPNEIGFENMKKIIKDSPQIDMNSLMKLKVKYE